MGNCFKTEVNQPEFDNIKQDNPAIDKKDVALDVKNPLSKSEQSRIYLKKNLELAKVAKTNYKNIIRYGYVQKVYDGDTITVAIAIDNAFQVCKIRLSDVDAPELKSKVNEEKEAAKIVRDKLIEKILHQVIVIKMNGVEKYGRILADIYVKNIGHVNKWLLDNKYAKNYDGGKKHGFTEDELKDIINTHEIV
jgi:endonuclease YncB( thermonuclease family)